MTRWILELWRLQPSSPGKGAYLCIPSVLSFISPLSDILPDPLPGQPVTCCLRARH